MSKLNIIPQPRLVETREGFFQLVPEARIVAEGAARPAAELLAEYLRPATGYALPVAEGAPRKGDLALAVTGADAQDEAGFYDESHRLEIGAEGVSLSGASCTALVRGIQTLRQLFGQGIYADTVKIGAHWRLPCALVEDSPSVRWRGVMLDSARHFFSVEQTCRMIELAAQLKLSVVHLHLTDDQGWRLEIKKYPKLTEVGGTRPRTQSGHSYDRPLKYDETPHTGFYTQDDIRAIVAFAAKRGIMVVPEIDLPGHMVAAIASYPELGNYPAHRLEVRDCWGISYNILSPRESTMAFLKDVFAEVVDLFPARFIDIGGDEARKDEWKICHEVQRIMAEKGVRDEEELQQWMTNEIGAYLATLGRRTIGWDDILNPEMPRDAAIMNWHDGENSTVRQDAARMGRAIVLTPHAYTYFDYYQADPRHEPLAIGGDISLEKAYRFEVLDSKWTQQERDAILGAQAQLWAEYIPDAAQQEYMAFPRLCALAEKTWLAGATPGYHDFCTRLLAYYGIFEAQKVNARPLD